MKKLLITILFSCTLIFSTFAQSNITNFIKGNINDKTTAVKSASSNEISWLSMAAIDFSIENKEILKEDRELDALAVAGILSLPVEYVSTLDENRKNELETKLGILFNEFNSSSNVQIAIISKISSLKDSISYSKITTVFNNYIIDSNTKTYDASVLKAVITGLEDIGNNQSFIILYNCWKTKQYEPYDQVIEQTLQKLIPVSIDEILQIIHEKNASQIVKISALTLENENLSQKIKCEIAENILSESILLVESSLGTSQKLIDIQLKAIAILNENNWTRASTVAVTYLDQAKTLYENKLIDENQFILVITSLKNIAPINAVKPLCLYLEELNTSFENSKDVNPLVVEAVINTLGAIGDNSAFDLILNVTYLNYPETVLSAARNALTGLRWH